MLHCAVGVLQVEEELRVRVREVEAGDGRVPRPRLRAVVRDERAVMCQRRARGRKQRRQREAAQDRSSVHRGSGWNRRADSLSRPRIREMVLPDVRYRVARYLVARRAAGLKATSRPRRAARASTRGPRSR